jgi:hypothetical protein
MASTSHEMLFDTMCFVAVRHGEEIGIPLELM